MNSNPLLVLLLVLLSCTTMMAQKKKGIDVKVKIKNPIDKAKLRHFEALKLFQEGKAKLENNQKKQAAGKIKQAIKKLKKAIKLNRTNEYLVDLASMYESEGKYKKAFNTVKKLVPNDKGTKLAQVTLLANKATYGMYLSMGIEAHETFGTAIKKMKLYQIDSVSFLSTLYNNYAISKIFYQTTPAQDTLQNIHIRDIKKARGYLQKAISLYPENCMAQYNLQFVSTLLEKLQWDSITNVPAYLRPQDITAINFPNANCLIPVRTIHENIVDYLNKEKEIVFVLDISGSMMAPATNGQTRIQAMKELVNDLFTDLDEAVEVGLLSLGQDCTAAPLHRIGIKEKAKRADLKQIVNGLSLNGCTPLNIRLKQAVDLFSKKRKREKAIFLCSDGLNYCGTKTRLNNESTCAVAQEVNKKGIKIYVFSLLLEDPTNNNEYAIYDCMTKATYGKLLGISETGYSIKTAFMDEPIYSLPLKKEDLMIGKYQFPDLNQERYEHNNQEVAAIH